MKIGVARKSKEQKIREKAIKRREKEFQKKKKLVDSMDGKKYAKVRDKYMLISRGSRFILRGMIFIYFILLVVGGSLAFYYFDEMIADVPDIDNDALVDNMENSFIYDVDGNVIMELGVSKRDKLEKNEMTDEVRNAVISVEDKRFYEHHGFDIIRLLKAVQVSLTGGFGEQGGSTLTQQLVKLSFLDQYEDTLERKSQELYLSWQMEDRYEKDDILNMYINSVYMGNGIYGMETGSQYYYGKKFAELDYHEKALIVGIPNRPETYNPYADTEAAKQRRDTILYVYLNNGYITEQEYNTSVNTPVLEGVISYEDNLKREYHQLNEVEEHLITPVNKVIGDMEEQVDDLYVGGYHIYTKIDPEKQKYAYELVNTNNLVDYKDDEMIVSVALINNHTGEVEFVEGGSRVIDKEVSGYNYVYDLQRQPGSAIKPILDYAPYIETYGETAKTLVNDAPVSYTSGQEIGNYYGDFRGRITLEDALVESRNTPAYRVFYDTGFLESYEIANKLGMGFTEEQMLESGSLGGVPNANPFNMARAFSVFPNNGKYMSYSLIDYVEKGEEELIRNSNSSKNAIKESTAKEMNTMLRSVVTKDNGTANELRMKDRYIAGKTGTTNFDEDEHINYNIPDRGAPDSWFVGYDDKYSVAVWIGFDNRSQYIPLENQEIPKEVAKEIWLNYINENSPVE